MLWVDRKYINLLSGRLRNFKWKQNNLVNCSCPICGDSKKNKSKARFFFFEEKDRFDVHCHNCGYHNYFDKFLEFLDSTLYEEYIKEIVLEKYNPTKTNINVEIPKIVVQFDKTVLSQLSRVSQLEENHICRQYVKSRLIPEKYYYKLYFCENFKEFVNQIHPKKAEKLPKDNRIIIPFLDSNKKLFGFQGRSIHNSKNGIRYITIMLNEEMPKIFGLDTVNFDKKFYIVEGPIDSMFLSNSIAMAGSSLAKINFKNGVFVYDNEPRNKSIIRFIEKNISKNHKVCIWPNSLKYKDINDMVLGKISPRDIETLIDNNTYSDLTAQLQLQQWRKV